MIRTNNFQIFTDGSIRFTLPSNPNLKEINNELEKLKTNYTLEYRKQEKAMFLICLKSGQYTRLRNYVINYFYK